MVALLQAVLCLSGAAAGVAGGSLVKRQSSSFSSKQFTWYAPGNPYNGYVVQFVWPYGTVWVANGSLGAAYVDLAFTVDSQQQLISHSKTLCLLDPGQSSGYWVGDPTVFQDHPACRSGNNWGLYRGAFLTLGGGYDMFCLFTNSGGDALAQWVPGIPAFERGGSACANRGRISVNGFSVQPAPATPVSPTSTVSMKPTTQPTTTPTPPPTTTTGKPNPIITSLISTASSYISLASAAASSYTANATNSASAKAAETALEVAITYVYDAMDASNDFSATSIAQKLDNTAEQLFKAAVAILAAEAILTTAAASAFAAALAPVAALFSSASSAANDPAQNPSPSPSKTTTTTTTTSSTPYVCTICIACADSSLAQPTSTDEPEKRELAFSSLNTRDIYNLTLEPLYHAEKRFQPANSPPSWHNDQVLVRTANFCPSISITVPDYESYHSAGTGLRNPYTNYYNYYQDSSCGQWQYKSLAGQSPNFVAPANDRVPDSNNYATEHIYEIQSIRQFFEYAVANDPTLKQAYSSSYTAFCNGLGSWMANAGQFSQYPYDYNVAPIKQIYSQLQNMASEFVYLESKLNGMKGILFGTRNPSTQAEYQAALAYASRIYIVEDYLTRSEISTIYKRVSARIREAIHQFGQACNDSSANAQYHKFGTIDWYSLYDRWESSYLDDIQEIMRAAALGNANSALGLIQARILNRGLSRVERNDFTKLRVYVQSNEGILGIISLNSLRR